MAGKPIGEIPGGGYWKAVLEGIQSDQDYLRLMFNLKRGPNTQLICHYCDSVQWVSTKSAIGPLNNPESLYTVYGPREGDCTILHKHYGLIFDFICCLCGSCAFSTELVFCPLEPLLGQDRISR